MDFRLDRHDLLDDIDHVVDNLRPEDVREIIDLCGYDPVSDRKNGYQRIADGTNIVRAIIRYRGEAVCIFGIGTRADGNAWVGAYCTSKGWRIAHVLQMITTERGGLFEMCVNMGHKVRILSWRDHPWSKRFLRNPRGNMKVVSSAEIKGEMFDIFEWMGHKA